MTDDLSTLKSKGAVRLSTKMADFANGVVMRRPANPSAARDPRRCPTCKAPLPEEPQYRADIAIWTNGRRRRFWADVCSEACLPSTMLVLTMRATQEIFDAATAPAEKP